MLTLAKWGNTIATTYSSSVKSDIFEARARKYPNTLEASLYGNEIPRSVCDNLISEIHGRLDAMGRYIKLRGRLLGLDTVRPYDMYTPIVGDVDMGLDYEHAYDEVVKSLRAAGRGVRLATARGPLRALDRRLRKPRQDQRRILHRRFRRAPLRAAQLPAHARQPHDDSPRDGPRDAQLVLAAHSALPHRRLLAVRGRGRVDLQRDAGHARSAAHRDRQAPARVPAQPPAGAVPHDDVPPDPVRRVRDEGPRSGRSRRAAHQREPVRALR